MHLFLVRFKEINEVGLHFQLKRNFGNAVKFICNLALVDYENMGRAMSKSSKFPGFYKLTPKERVQIVREFANLTNEEVAFLSPTLAS